MSYFRKAIYFEEELLRRDGPKHDEAWRQARRNRILELRKERDSWRDEEDRLARWFDAQDIKQEMRQSFPTGEEDFRCRKCGKMVDSGSLCPGCQWEDMAEHTEQVRR